MTTIKNSREDSEVSFTSASKSLRLFDFFLLMRKLTQFGKRVMAGVGLVLLCAVVAFIGVVMMTGGGNMFHINPQVFNVIGIVIVLPILCKLIIDMIFIIRHGRLS